MEKSTQGEKNLGSSLTNTIKKNVRFEQFLIYSHLLLPCGFHYTLVFEK